MTIEVVVASIRSWDGTRVLGVFDNESIALEVCKNIVDVNCEDFSLDFVVMNKLSLHQSMEVNGKSNGGCWRRKHVYEEV